MTLTKLKKFKISKMFMVLLVVSAISFTVMSTTWVMSVNELEDSIREGAIHNKAIVATVFAWTALAVALTGLWFVKKKSDNRTLFIFIVIASVLIFSSFLLTVGDQKDFKDAMEDRRNNLSELFAQATYNAKLSWLTNHVLMPGTPMNNDIIHMVGKDGLHQMSLNFATVTDDATFITKFGPFLEKFNALLEGNLAEAQENLYVASIAVFSSIAAVITLSAGFIFIRSDKLTAQAK